jgi:hypothetical protein
MGLNLFFLIYKPSFLDITNNKLKKQEKNIEEKNPGFRAPDFSINQNQ